MDGDEPQPVRWYVTEQWEDGAEGLVEVEEDSDGRRRVRMVYLPGG